MSLLKDNHYYSFSQLSTFSNCPYAFYLDKIEKESQTSNCFAEQGSLIHDLIDQWAKGEIKIEDLADKYCKRYPDEVVTPAPKMLARIGYEDKAFNLGLDYFKNFDGFPEFEIEETERKYPPFNIVYSKIEIEDYYEDDVNRPSLKQTYGTIIEDGKEIIYCNKSNEDDCCIKKCMIGIIDMICKDKKTNEWIILDHKSKSLKAFKESEEEMYRQQYLYSTPFYIDKNIYPDRLVFNLFKEGGLKQERKFNIKEYNETLFWAIRCIEKIESFDVMDFITECKEKTKKDCFFCENICGVRKNCPNGDPENKPVDAEPKTKKGKKKK